MNRAERRRLSGEKHSRTPAQNETPICDLKNGEKVRLYSTQIKKFLASREGVLPEYKEFVQANSNKVFTVKNTASNGENVIVTLDEDGAECKWLFWRWDLLTEKQFNEKRPNDTFEHNN
ncbi:MAG: hypothetical protein RR365_10820 [Bacteroides sp.]